MTQMEGKKYADLATALTKVYLHIWDKIGQPLLFSLSAYKFNLT